MGATGAPPLVAGNWKLHGSLASAAALTAAVAAGTRDAPGVEVVVCPTFAHLQCAADHLDGALKLGAQDLSDRAEGAFTGEVSGAMLVELGCSHVIVGHSERRQLRGEDDALVAAKTRAALDAGLTPLVCVGETADERAGGRARAVVGAQLDALGDAAARGIVVAYEPVWAIGAGRSAAPGEVGEMHAFVRERLAARGAAARVVYGGSVKPDNMNALLECDGVDGFLIGGASLDAAAFCQICRAVADFRK